MAKTKINPDAEDNVSTALSTSTPTTTTALDVQGDQYLDDPHQDVIVPILGLINKVGGLSEKFENKAGQFAIGDVLLGEKVLVIPISAVKLWEETHRNGNKLEFKKPPIPRIFTSEKQAMEAGYINDFSHTAPNRIGPIAKIGFLVVAPKDDASEDFVIKVGDIQTQPARSIFRKKAFKDVFGIIYNHVYKRCLSRQISIVGLSPNQIFSAGTAWSHVWTLKSVVEKNDQNSWYAPSIEKGAALTPEQVNWITENFSIQGS